MPEHTTDTDATLPALPQPETEPAPPRVPLVPERSLRGLEGGVRVSIPNVPFVEINLVSSQELPVLIFKRDAAVVFLLASNVPFYFRDVRLAD